MNCSICGCECDDLVCEDCRMENVEDGTCRGCGENPVELGDLCGNCFLYSKLAEKAIDEENAECDPFDGILY